MTVAERIDKEVRDALDIETRPLFPSAYNGCIEADALAQGEDTILRILGSAIYRYFQNRNLQTMNEETVQIFENGFGIQGTGTLEERRAAVIGIIRSRFVFNDAAMAAMIETLAGVEPVKFSIDPQSLVLRIWRDGGEDGGQFVAYDIAQALAPVIPLNIKTETQDRQTAAIDVYAQAGCASAIKIGLRAV